MQHDDVLQQQLRELREHWEQRAEFYKRQAGWQMGMRLRQKLEARQQMWEQTHQIIYLVRLWTSQQLMVFARWLDPTPPQPKPVAQEEEHVIDSTCRPVEPE